MTARFSKFVNEAGDNIVVRHDAIRYVVRGKTDQLSVLVLENETRLTVCHSVDRVYEILYKNS